MLRIELEANEFNTLLQEVNASNRGGSKRVGHSATGGKCSEQRRQ